MEARGTKFGPYSPTILSSMSHLLDTQRGADGKHTLGKGGLSENSMPRIDCSMPGS